jgi:hypothetical protein
MVSKKAGQLEHHLVDSMAMHWETRTVVPTDVQTVDPWVAYLAMRLVALWVEHLVEKRVGLLDEKRVESRVVK